MFNQLWLVSNHDKNNNEESATSLVGASNGDLFIGRQPHYPTSHADTYKYCPETPLNLG
jgi:hypothetical protein